MTEISRATIPACTIVGLRKTIAEYHEEAAMWQELERLFAQSNVPVVFDGMCGTTFHDLAPKPTDIDVEVWLEVSEPCAVTPPLKCHELPEREVLRAVLHGDYSQIPSVVRDVETHAATHDLRTGAMFNIYRVGPAQTPDSNAWVTELHFPITQG